MFQIQFKVYIYMYLLKKYLLEVRWYGILCVELNDSNKPLKINLDLSCGVFLGTSFFFFSS